MQEIPGVPTGLSLIAIQEIFINQASVNKS